MVAIIWLIVGAKLIHQIQTNAKLRENKKKASNFNRVSVNIIQASAFNLSAILTLFVFSSPPSLYYAVYSYS
jgi:hypothetical protein